MKFEEFKKVDLRVAKIISAEKVPDSEKLLRLEIDCGDRDEKTNLPAVRQVVSGIAKAYELEKLIGREIIIVANLEPRQFTLRQSSGQVVLESNGMLLAARDADGLPILIVPEKEAPTGTRIS